VRGGVLAALLVGVSSAAWAATGPSAPAAAGPARPEGGAGTVTLPLADFDRLVARAARPPARPSPPPIGATVGSAAVHVRVDGGHARTSVRLEGEVFAKGIAAVPIVASVPIADGRQGSHPLALRRGDRQHAALLDGPGPFTLDLDLALAVVPETGSASLVIPAFPAAGVRAEIDVPGEGTDVRLTGGVIVKRSVAGGRAVVEAALEPDRPARVSWTSRETAAPATPREARWLADVKTLVTLDEADVRLTCLVGIDIIVGEPKRFELELPDGFDLVDVSGPSLESTDRRTPGRLGLVPVPGPARQHQFLVVLERATSGAVFEPPLLSVTDAQRETGEIAAEGVGTLELHTEEAGPLRRVDVRELSAPLRALARHPLLAGFRYHRRAADPPALKLDVRRFPDASLLAAVAERATVTTLATVQGRRLTEVSLRVRNQAQPFVKVDLPEGAQILSAEVAGEKVKPVLGPDGTRVPLLRPSFRPQGPYAVSFVYVESGAPLGRKGEARLTLARLDVPVEIVEWELFLPDRYRLKNLGGNVVRAEPGETVRFAGPVPGDQGGVVNGRVGGVIGGPVSSETVATLPLQSRQAMSLMRLLPGVGGGVVRGRVLDATGQALPGATVTGTVGATTRVAIAGGDGGYTLAGLPSGPLTLKAERPGFKTTRRSGLDLQGSGEIDLTLELGILTETTEVVAEAPVLETQSSVSGFVINGDDSGWVRAPEEDLGTAPSANVMNLQRRVAGVMPVEVDVPHTGTSHRFIRPLALDDETTVSFQYRAR
jgi:hypothetical protein